MVTDSDDVRLRGWALGQLVVFVLRFGGGRQGSDMIVLGIPRATE